MAAPITATKLVPAGTVPLVSPFTPLTLYTDIHTSADGLIFAYKSGGTSTIPPFLLVRIPETGSRGDSDITTAQFNYESAESKLGYAYIVQGTTFSSTFLKLSAEENPTSITSTASTPAQTSTSPPATTSSSPNSSPASVIEPSGTLTAGSSSSRTPVGAIAGGVLGGLIVLALLLAGTLILLRRQRRKRDAQGAGDSAAIENSEKESVYMDRGDGSGLHELHGQGLAQELDPRRGHIVPMPAPELAHERAPVEAETGREQGRGNNVSVQNESSGGGQDEENESTQPSAAVQRQRDVEIEWLENEEARLRERKELLRRQQRGGGK